jgi:hypothetical protein
MATPVVENVRLDKQSYVPGTKATLTFDAYDPDSRQVEVTITVSDSSGSSEPVTVTLNINDPITTTVTDSEGRSWTKVGAVGVTQTWEATV